MTVPSVLTSVGQVQARVAAIEARLGVRPATATGTPAAAGATGTDFATVLAQATGRAGPGSASGAGTAAGAGATAGAGTAAAVRAGAELPATGDAIAQAAQEYLGIPYVWGGTDPATGLDCSGFTQHVFRRAGIELPRVSADQARTGQPVPSMAQARPGDLLAWDTGPRNVGADHVAIYLGDGMMIEAPGRGGEVRITPVRRTPDDIRRLVPDVPPAGPAASTAAWGAAPVTMPAGTTPYADLFAAAGARHGVDPTLLALVAEHESSFDPRAVSPAGAQGLMQLMPGTAAGLGVSDPFDPGQAVDGAARLLADHLRQFGSVELALAAYNAGPGAVTRHGGIPPYQETQRYVQRITARYGGTP